MVMGDERLVCAEAGVLCLGTKVLPQSCCSFSSCWTNSLVISQRLRFFSASQTGLFLRSVSSLSVSLQMLVSTWSSSESFLSSVDRFLLLISWLLSISSSSSFSFSLPCQSCAIFRCQLLFQLCKQATSLLKLLLRYCSILRRCFSYYSTSFRESMVSCSSWMCRVLPSSWPSIWAIFLLSRFIQFSLANSRSVLYPILSLRSSMPTCLSLSWLWRLLMCSSRLVFCIMHSIILLRVFSISSLSSKFLWASSWNLFSIALYFSSVFSSFMAIRWLVCSSSDSRLAIWFLSCSMALWALLSSFSSLVSLSVSLLLLSSSLISLLWVSMSLSLRNSISLDSQEGPTLSLGCEPMMLSIDSKSDD